LTVALMVEVPNAARAAARACSSRSMRCFIPGVYTNDN
jgi:hypothetical protein